MHLSESFNKNIIESAVGSIFNSFKFHRRRDVFFFEDISSRYAFECDRSGFADDMYDLGKDAGYLMIECLLPDVMRSLPGDAIINHVMRSMWQNLGLMDDVHIVHDDGHLLLNTKSESLTRIIGENRFTEGLYSGVLSSIYHCDVSFMRSSHAGDNTEYEYVCNKSPYTISHKTKSEYVALNMIPGSSGASMKDALRSGMLVNNKNRIYFRDHPIAPIENTIFHLAGIRNINLEILTNISYDYFNSLIKESGPEKRLLLLKNMLQVLGWGITNISFGSDVISFTIRYPPCGLQETDDNWHYISRVIEGYIKIIDKGYSLKKYEYSNRVLLLEYCLS